MRDGIAESRHLICVRSTSRRAKRGSIGLRMLPPMLWKILCFGMGVFRRRVGNGIRKERLCATE